MFKVATIIEEGLAPFEFGVSCEVFGIDRTAQGGPAFEHRVVGEHPGVPVRTNQGFSITAEYDLSFADEADLVVAPPTWNYGRNVPSDAVLDVLRRAHDRGAWLMSLCSGAFTLAQAGALAGRRATTHWMYADRLQAEYPDTIVEPDVLFVDDRKVITAAGTAAGIDAALHLVRTTHGAAAANVIARRMIVPPHRDGGQAQYVKHPMPVVADDSLGPVIEWMLAHLAEDLPVERLAQKALMSPRTFARRFRADFGTTPAAWLNRQRLTRAQELLETTGLGIDQVATEAGFGSGAVMRHHFAQALQTTPVAYRATFSCVDAA